MYAYTSVDSGQSWKEAGVPTDDGGDAIACSATGTKLIAASSDGVISISDDFGTNWVTVIDPPNSGWLALASSSDGTILAAAGSQGWPSSENVVVSTDAGLTWNFASVPAEYWRSIACSSDGSRLAVASDTVIYLSADAGATGHRPMRQPILVGHQWPLPPMERNWLAASGYGGIYTWQITPTPFLGVRASGTSLLLSLGDSLHALHPATKF